MSNGTRPVGGERSPQELREAIQAAYRDLRGFGYFCRANFWCCCTCASAAIPEQRSSRYVYYHRQDNGDINREGRCYLAWAGVGHEIIGALNRSGLHTIWDGNPERRILIY